ncbi:polysaccharide deacetylase family protein [Christiangramia fulva]|uniref:Polysaccharide deacetylase family protein n=1 Tax=Christiangramia fulva TaxID=2126553 RepID=A0A2R3Z4S6_9FLAO|nr:polysaccharide deacetylase family protein [Christiangramia fulva]AVR45261.1 polysaccharide deacetylase family protein [Christiangramia fulva]
MKLFRAKYPSILRLLYPHRVSKISSENSIYLTFDDGPVPEVTPWVLDLLAKYDAKATFFCIGDNVKKHPDVFREVLANGHVVGNHTFNHIKGWKTSDSDYIENTLKAENLINQLVYEEKRKKTLNSELLTLNSKSRRANSELRTPNLESRRANSEHYSCHPERSRRAELLTPNYKLFRPPYGRIKNSQASKLVKKGFKIVMWDVVSGDYEPEFSASQCFDNVVDNAEAGSTIVFHDSEKAFPNLQKILPDILKYYSEKGYQFRSLRDVL